MRLKLLVWREPSFTLRICEKNSSVIVRFEILQWLYGPEKFPGPSRNGPQEIQFLHLWSYFYSKDNHCKTVQRVAVSIIHESHWLRKGLLPQLLLVSQSNWNLAFFAIPSRVSFSTKAHKAVCLINWFADSTVLARFTRAWRLREKKKTLVDQIGTETEKNRDNR